MTAKKTTAKKTTARRVTVERSPQEKLHAAIESLHPSKRSTPEQRRELLIGALRRAEQLAYDDSVPSSVQIKSVSELRTIAKQLSDLDAELEAPAAQWGADELGAV